jgi:hypothetical protein
MNKTKIIRRILFPAVFSILLVCFCLCGCAEKPKTVYDVQPAVNIQTDNVLDIITCQANRFTSFKAGMKFKIIVHDKAKPRIKGHFMWAKTPRAKLVRVTGYSFLGINVFDCMITGNYVYLFIPSHKAVYTTNINEKLENSKKIVSLINEASWLLNPWSIVEAENIKVTCGKEKRDFRDCERPIYINFSNQGETGLAKFDQKTLSPISLEDNKLQVLYDEPLLLGDYMTYPSKICIKFKELDLEIKITLENIQTNSLTPSDPMFDPTPYFNQPFKPLALLIEALRCQTHSL